MKISSVCILASMASKDVCEDLSAVTIFVGFLTCSSVAKEKRNVHENQLAVVFGTLGKEQLEGKLQFRV